jgi:hypothetical protein
LVELHVLFWLLVEQVSVFTADILSIRFSAILA